MTAALPVAPACRNPLTEKIVVFLRAIGLDVRTGIVTGATALSGIDIRYAELIVDEDRLDHPGDLLHEAGHLAVALPRDRAQFHHDVGNDGGEELGAIAWSYAAALHLKIDPALVFHEAGYRGDSAMILANFGNGHPIGVPWLSYCGMACEPRRAESEGVEPYPHMLRWLRET